MALFPNSIIKKIYILRKKFQLIVSVSSVISVVEIIERFVAVKTYAVVFATEHKSDN
jgi:hypothetical protein